MRRFLKAFLCATQFDAAGCDVAQRKCHFFLPIRLDRVPWRLFGAAFTERWSFVARIEPSWISVSRVYAIAHAFATDALAYPR